MNIQEIELKNIKANSSQSCILASFAIIFVGDKLKLTGFRIMEKNNKRWLNPPSNMDNKGDWHKTAILTDKQEWKKLEQRVLKEYEEQQSNPLDISPIRLDEIPQ